MKEQRHCSFCGKNEDLVKRLIRGNDGAHICDECILICGDMIKEVDAPDEDEKVPLKTPAEIKEELDKYIVVSTKRKRCFPLRSITTISA